MNKHFPINFFSSLFSVNKMFVNRDKYNWAQLLLIFIFVNSLLLIPLSLSVTQRGSELVDELIPQEFVLQESTVEAINALSFEDFQLVTDHSEVIEENPELIVGTNLTEETINHRMGLNFQKDILDVILLRDGETYAIQLVYSDNLIGNLKQEDILTGIKEEVFRQNAGAISLSSILNLGFIILMMNVLLLAGVAVVFFLTKKASAIKNFKESVTIALSLMTGGTIIATLASIITKDIFVLFGIQSLWMVGLTIFMYVSTRFKETE